MQDCLIADVQFVRVNSLWLKFWRDTCSFTQVSILSRYKINEIQGHFFLDYDVSILNYVGQKKFMK